MGIAKGWWYSADPDFFKDDSSALAWVYFRVTKTLSALETQSKQDKKRANYHDADLSLKSCGTRKGADGE